MSSGNATIVQILVVPKRRDSEKPLAIDWRISSEESCRSTESEAFDPFREPFWFGNAIFERGIIEVAAGVINRATESSRLVRSPLHPDDPQSLMSSRFHPVCV